MSFASFVQDCPAGGKKQRKPCRGGQDNVLVSDPVVFFSHLQLSEILLPTTPLSRHMEAFGFTHFYFL